MVNPPLQNLIVKCNQRCIFQENKVVFNLRSCPILGVTQRQKEANLVIYSSVENRLLAYLCYSNNIYRQSGENIMFSLVMSFLHLSVKLESGLIGHLIHDKILESHLFQVHRLHRRVYPWVNPASQESTDLELWVWCQIYNEEWSYGFCDFGTGVFSCAPKSNPMYTYRETVILGRTRMTRTRVNQIIHELSNKWAGTSYDLLSRNCNHFCEELCSRLGVHKIPCTYFLHFTHHMFY